MDLPVYKPAASGLHSTNPIHHPRTTTVRPSIYLLNLFKKMYVLVFGVALSGVQRRQAR